MQTLKDHFNSRAKRQRKRRKAERERDLAFLVLWLFFLMAEERRSRRIFDGLCGPP